MIFNHCDANSSPILGTYGMNDTGISTRYVFYVSYGETDAMKVAYYGEYFHWFEQARSQLIRERGLSYAQVEEKGILLPVRHAECRYVHPARFDQKLTIHCSIQEFGRASLNFGYQVLGPDGGLLAHGSTQHACVGPQGRPVRMPQWLKDLLTDGTPAD